MNWTRVTFDYPSDEYVQALHEITEARSSQMVTLVAQRDRHPSIWTVEDIGAEKAYIYFSPGSSAWFGRGLPAGWVYEPCDKPAATGIALNVGDARDWDHYGFIAPGRN